MAADERLENEQVDEALRPYTQEQRNNALQFMAFTEQDPDVAVKFLVKSDWNAGVAITKFYDGDPDPEPNPEPREAIPPPQSARRQETLANGFSDIRQMARHQLPQAPRVVGQPENHINPRAPLILTVVLTPLNIAFGLVSRLYNIVAYLCPPLARFLRRILSRPTSTLHQSIGSRPALGPYETAVRFQREFTAAYGDHPLPLMECSYARAYDLAKQQFKFLLVIPIAPEHVETDSFVRNILLSPQVIQDLTESANHVLVWAGSVSDSEPYQVATSLNVTQFPSAVLIANTGTPSAPTMSVIARILRPKNADEFCNVLKTTSSLYSGSMAQSRSARTEQQATRNLRTEQETAYERSLAKDREKVRAKKAADDEKRVAALAEKEAQHREEQYARDLAAWRTWKASTLPAEPSREVKDAVRTSIRLPDGEKVMRRFPTDAPLEHAYAFVECHDELRGQQGMSGHSEKRPIQPPGFQHRYGFQLVSPMPRTIYDLKAGGTMVERVGRSANLIAERVEAEDDESDVN